MGCSPHPLNPPDKAFPVAAQTAVGLHPMAGAGPAVKVNVLQRQLSKTTNKQDKHRTMKKTFTTIIGVAAIAMTLTQTARAVPITGNIGMSGAVILDSNDAQTATEVVGWENTVVNGRSGSFASIANNTAVAMASPWFFNSGALNNFWVVGGFSFNLISSQISTQNGIFLDVLLSGTVTGNGFDKTAFSGSFQLANPPSNSGLDKFTSRLSFTSVPDGGNTVLLLGMACVGMYVLKRKLATIVTPVS